MEEVNVQEANNEYQAGFHFPSFRHLEFPYNRHRHNVDDQVRYHERQRKHGSCDDFIDAMSWNLERVPEMCDRRAIAAYGNENPNAIGDDHCADNPNCLSKFLDGESASVEDEDRDLDKCRGDSL